MSFFSFLTFFTMFDAFFCFYSLPSPSSSELITTPYAFSSALKISWAFFFSNYFFDNHFPSSFNFYILSCFSFFILSSSSFIAFAAASFSASFLANSSSSYFCSLSPSNLASSISLFFSRAKAAAALTGLPPFFFSAPAPPAEGFSYLSSSFETPSAYYNAAAATSASFFAFSLSFFF